MTNALLSLVTLGWGAETANLTLRLKSGISKYLPVESWQPKLCQKAGTDVSELVTFLSAHKRGLVC